MDENIFEAASKQAKAKKNKPLEGKSEQGTSQKKVDLANQEVEEMLLKMQTMREDLENQLNNVYQKGSASNINVDHLIDNAGALAVKNLDKMKEQEKILSDKIGKAISSESCLRKNPKSKETLTQERKGKMRGSRNNWIPVR
jgi:hypothetical protein